MKNLENLAVVAAILSVILSSNVKADNWSNLLQGMQAQMDRVQQADNSKYWLGNGKECAYTLAESVRRNLDCDGNPYKSYQQRFEDSVGDHRSPQQRYEDAMRNYQNRQSNGGGRGYYGPYTPPPSPYKYYTDHPLR